MAIRRLNEMDGTVVIVAYATEELDLSWIPASAPVIVVHNDESLDAARCMHPGISHLHPGENLGFGGGVNHALSHVTTQRVVLVNPDATLTDVHWRALDGEDDDVVTVPIVDRDGHPTVVVAPYWKPATLLATTYRIGDRFAPIGSTQRTAVGRLSGFVGSTVGDDGAVGSWPLSQRWVSGAVMSLATARLTEVGGFDESYFLYFEDADLCARLAQRFPTMNAVCRTTPPVVHTVGGSSTGVTSEIDEIRRESAFTYASRQSGPQWAPLRALARRQDAA